MKYEMLSGLGGGPSCVWDVVAQEQSARLLISRRAFSPPSIDVSLPPATLLLYGFPVALQGRFAF
jgi:hypothetical protein